MRLLVLLLVACSSSPEGWHVAGGALRDPEGRAVVLRGMNVSSRHKTPPFIDFHGPEDWRRLRVDWGMNAVRYLVSWAALEPEAGVYDEAYLALVVAKLAEARDAGLLVVVDMHQDVYGLGFAGTGNGAPAWTCDASKYAAFTPRTPWFANYGDPNVIACYDGFWGSAELQAHYTEAWRRLARALAGNIAVVGFDPMNEPYWGSRTLDVFERDVLSPFYAQIAAAVRAEAPDWIAFLEPASSRNLGFATRLDLYGIGDVVYAPHSYDAAAESGMGFDDTRRAAVLANAADLREEADALGAALWIGEYGGTASHPGIVAYMDAGYDAAAEGAAGSMYWHYGRDGGYGVLDASGAEKPELMSVLVRPFPERVAGDLRRWSYDEGTRTLTISLDPSGGTTVISVPLRVYPDGVRVECGGCTVVATPGQVKLTGVTSAMIVVSAN